MSESDLYERLGRKQAQIEQQDAAYNELLSLLAQVVGGAVEPSRVLVNLTDRTWVRSLPGERPGCPAQINGLPNYVVAPDEPPPLP